MLIKAEFYWEEINKEFILYIPVYYKEGLNNYF